MPGAPAAEPVHCTLLRRLRGDARSPRLTPSCRLPFAAGPGALPSGICAVLWRRRADGRLYASAAARALSFCSRSVAGQREGLSAAGVRRSFVASSSAALNGRRFCNVLPSASDTSRPGSLPSGLEGLGALKLLSQPVCESAGGNPAGVLRALQQAGAAVEALWPASADPKRQEARRLLASRDWVPYVPPPTSEAAGGAAEQAAPPPDTPLAASLRAALERHCPGISLEDIRCAALVGSTSTEAGR